MTKRVGISIAMVAAALFPGSVPAKEFHAVGVVGSGGGSVEVRGRVLADSLSSGMGPARPRGGYLRLYSLGTGGFVGVPGRFYPATAAVCLDWDQSRPPRDCRRAVPRLARALRALRLARFVGAPTTVHRLTGEQLTRVQLRQLEVVFEFAFDRWKLSRLARRPPRCYVFRAWWRGPLAAARPTAFCLSARGAYADGRLYPLGRAPWSLVVGWAGPRAFGETREVSTGHLRQTRGHSSSVLKAASQAPPSRP